jgi:hypothetical protein
MDPVLDCRTKWRGLKRRPLLNYIKKGEKMKKIFVILAIMLFFLSGCDDYTANESDTFSDWIKYRYYEDDILAYFAERDFSIDTFSLYNLVWNIKSSEAVNMTINADEIIDDLSSMDNQYYYQSDIDQYGEEYVVYLCSELYRYNHNIISEPSVYDEQISRLTRELLLNTNEEDVAAKAALLIKASVNFNFKDDNFNDLVELVESTFNDSATEFLELVKDLDCIEIMLLSGQIEHDIIVQRYNSIDNRLQALVSSIDLNNISVLSTTIMKMLQIEDQLNISGTANSGIILTVYDFKEYYAGLDIQTKYEVYTILSHNDIEVDDPSIKSFFEYKLYLCPFWQSIRTLYYGTQLSDLHSFSYDAKKVLAYAKRTQPQSYRSISDLYYYYMVYETLNAENTVDISSAFQTLADSYQQDKMSFEELYYFHALSDISGQKYEYKSIYDVDLNQVGRLDELYYLLQLLKYYGIEVDNNKIINLCDSFYNSADGGYCASSEYRQSSITATYFALLIYDDLQVTNEHKMSILEFVENMKLDGGGVREIQEHTSNTFETYFRATWIIEHLT